MSEHEVWRSKLDERYDCVVMGQDDNGYEGQLTITDSVTGEQLFHKHVIMFGAQFGPDMSDVADWQEICTTIVDGLT